MVNYHDPIVIAQDYSVASKIWHAMAGLYFWEFVTTLDYEWSVFRRHRPFRWTIWIYFASRIATLTAVVLFLVDVNVTTRFNCKVETIFLTAFASLVIVTSSLLIVLRMYVLFPDPIIFYNSALMGTVSLAIWNMNKIVIAIATSTWGAGLISQIQTIVRVRVESIPGKATCVVANPHVTKLNILVTSAIDIVLLLIMFFGLFRLRFHKSSAFGMGRLLWRQGLVWLFVAFVADTLLTVFICLNLNDPLDDMFLDPWLVASSIAATRIHRGLADYASAGSTEQLFDPSHSKANGATEWKANRVPIMLTQLSRMEVAIPEAYKQDETLQMSQHGSVSSSIGVEGQLYEKPAGQPKLDENVENGVTFATESSVT